MAFQDTIRAADGGTFGAYVARPAQPNGHAIVFIQEIFGVTSSIRKAADRFAEAGYLVYAPDLFWRFEPGIELSHSRDDIQKAMGLMQRFDSSKGLADIHATAEHIRAQADFDGKVAVSGLCLGGLLTYLSCCQPGFDAGVAFYGVGIEKQLDQLSELACPLMLHFGRKDDFIPADAQEAIAKGLADHPRVELHFYDKAGHGFYTRGEPDDIALAHERSLAFLERNL